MSDTTLFTRKDGSKVQITSSLKAVILYVIADACVSLGQELSSMDQVQWNKLWAMQKIGFWLSQVGSTALMIKAFYSGSSPKPSTPVTPDEKTPTPIAPPDPTIR